MTHNELLKLIRKLRLACSKALSAMQLDGAPLVGGHHGTLWCEAAKALDDAIDEVNDCIGE